MENEAEITTVPLPPTNLKLDEKCLSYNVTLSWDAVLGADRYYIFYKCIGGDILWLQAPSVTSPTTTINTFHVFVCPSVTMLKFEVVALVEERDTTRISERSSTIFTQYVLSLQSFYFNETYSGVSWRDVENATGYTIFYSPSNGDQPSSFIVGTIRTVLTGLTPGELYRVGVQILFNNGTKKVHKYEEERTCLTFIVFFSS
ncbi:collagen alpha-1(XII) chain-like [Antedon mediterranea]|uniref:collagen alpha-1(XII) chain-like n=1 Tax=Antedon mediterranea TaxID=105859 RepID=UPI003AF41186